VETQDHTSESGSSSDEELARQSQCGSLAAFEELVSRYEGRIYRFVAHSCRGAMDAREVTQETFVRAFQAIAQFDPARPFAAWLFSIARRKCIDHFRASTHRTDDREPEAPAPDDPAESLARREDRQSLWLLARECLPETQFQALRLRYAEEMSVEEIARVLGKTRTHVKVLLFRAREALGCELKRERAAAASRPQDQWPRLSLIDGKQFL